MCPYPKFEVFVLETTSVNGLPASAVSVSEVPTLNHEIGNDTMEC